MLNKRLVSIWFLLIFLFSNIGWSMSVHYCQGEAHYSPLRYAHTHQEDAGTGCTMELEQQIQQEEKACCSTPKAVEKPVKKFEDKKCCQDELIKSNPSDHNIQPVYTPNFDFILPDYGWTTLATYGIDFPIQKQEISAYYMEANAPPLYQLYCRLVLYS
ncbi:MULTISPECIES: HYC_CC_PP family protein [unclassified Myroides]|uniref:HYC_CC_PP family protein n=1 Tax=unclassified Myroides TaxID=2642485 RepID=UPI003D2F800B